MRAITVVAVLVTSCGSGDALPPVGDLRSGEIVFAPTPAYSGACAVPEMRAVIATEAEWQQLWSGLFACASSVPALPSVDFAREMLIVAALGERSTTGYSVTIRQVAVARDDTLNVELVEYQPGRHCAVATMITYPVAVARALRTEAAVAFGREVKTVRCE